MLTYSIKSICRKCKERERCKNYKSVIELCEQVKFLVEKIHDSDRDVWFVVNRNSCEYFVDQTEDIKIKHYKEVLNSLYGRFEDETDL